jgi:hypothetical protein
MELLLTKAEADIWDWAVGAAQDFWSDDEGRDDGKHFEECPVKETKDGVAWVADDEDDIYDMTYRIDDQLRDMISEQGGCDCHGKWDKDRMKAISMIPVINSLVAKIKDAREKAEILALNGAEPHSA